MSEVDILWEGEIQGCALDKKKIWRPRTKLMQGSLIQSPSLNLKLELSADFTKLADKRTLPGSEEIALSSVTFIGEMMHSKEHKDFYFFCQCIKLDEDEEEEIIVHTFKTESEELRRRFIEAVFEYMQRRVIKQPLNHFNVIIEKEVLTTDGMKLYGKYTLRTLDTGIEFLISENIPGIKHTQTDIYSVKILEDNRPEVGEHMIDLIMRGQGLNGNYHIVMKSKGGQLLLVYLQRGLDDCIQELLPSRAAISSLPLTEIVHTPPIPPKPDNEPKPLLPPRSVSPNAFRFSNDFRKMGKVKFDLEDNSETYSPPLPPRDELAANSPFLPHKGIHGQKSVTLPRGMPPDFSQFEPDTRRAEYRRASEQIPPRLPDRNESRTLPRRKSPGRRPMPLPEEPSVLPEIMKPGVEARSGSLDDMCLVNENLVEPHYAEIKLGSMGTSESPTDQTVTRVENEEEITAVIHSENHKHRKPGFYKKQLCPLDLKTATPGEGEEDTVESDTPLTELVTNPEYVEIFSDGQTDESGYLTLLSPNLNRLDSLGYVTVGDIVISPNSNSNSRDSTPVQSPVVPPRTYRDFFK